MTGGADAGTGPGSAEALRKAPLKDRARKVTVGRTAAAGWSL